MSFVDQFVTQEFDGTAKANRQIISTIVEKLKVESAVAAVAAVDTIGKSMASDMAQANPAVREALERLLKKVSS